MKSYIKQNKYHVILIAVLLLIAGLAEAAVYFHYDRLLEHPVTVNRYLSIKPVYNEDGSWFHGKIGIGYIRWLLFLENAASLMAVLFLSRMMEAWGAFFQTGRHWNYLIDFAAAASLYRIFTEIRGVFTLDYLKIGGDTYDILDCCIGIGIIGIAFWYLSAMVSYRNYKKERIKGRDFLQRLRWELKFSGMLCKVSVLPKERWQEEFDAARLW